MLRRSQRNVGIIGLGIIGTRVMDTLRRKGFHVFVWSRSPRPIPNFVGAPAEVAEMCDYVQIFVSDDDALLDIVQQISPALAPRHIVLAHPTVAPHSMRAAADIVERRGARFVEAPFTGSKIGAEKGELVYYVAGDEVALREARPILEASAKEIIEIGEIGQATAIKVATNILTAAAVQAAAEALALVQNSGVSLEKFKAAMQSNASNSGVLSLKLPKMIEGDFEPHFSIKHMLKDMQIATRLGLLNHLELSVTTAARDRLLEQMQLGYGDEDFSAVVRKYFHEIRPAAQEEADLELFEQPRQVEQPAIPPEMHAPVALAWNNEAESAKAEMSSPALEPVESEAMPEIEVLDSPAEIASEVEKEESDLQNESAATPETTAPPEPEEAADVMPSHRGFIDRLLRRDSEH
jgi:3-hydroxyisobutyrate dehydrogenase-like beta-hydroxyacid dehydrogenase